MQFLKHLILKARAWPNVNLLWTNVVIAMRAKVVETEAVTIRETKLFTVSRMQTSGSTWKSMSLAFPRLDCLLRFPRVNVVLILRKLREKSYGTVSRAFLSV